MKLTPIDECARDASFAQFRTQLIRVADRKDLRRLLAFTADDIRTSFGSEGGKAEFVENWSLDAPSSSRFWSELLRILRLGCAVTDGYASAPYLSARFPDQLNAYDYVVTVHPRAEARAAPTPQSALLGTFANVILKIADDELVAGWMAVTLPDGRLAYISQSQVRSPVDFRAIFEKRNGKWVMAAFLAGD